MQPLEADAGIDGELLWAAAVAGDRRATGLDDVDYLLNAAEILNPFHPAYARVGDHDGLCEAEESCHYLPNFGAYQGHGPLGVCVYDDAGGPVTDVKVYGATENGI